uniref:Uncharacterized protein n=2 Tax=Streptomyces TaxID=1883 RepID=A0A8D4BEH2_STRFA
MGAQAVRRRQAPMRPAAAKPPGSYQGRPKKVGAVARPFPAPAETVCPLRERLPTVGRTENQLASAQVWVAQSSKLVQETPG